MKQYIEPKIKCLVVDNEPLMDGSPNNAKPIYPDSYDTSNPNFLPLTKEHHSVWDSEDEEN